LSQDHVAAVEAVGSHHSGSAWVLWLVWPSMRHADKCSFRLH
jgi:hypothetical protein